MMMCGESSMRVDGEDSFFSHWMVARGTGFMHKSPSTDSVLVVDWMKHQEAALGVCLLGRQAYCVEVCSSGTGIDGPSSGCC